MVSSFFVLDSNPWLCEQCGFWLVDKLGLWIVITDLETLPRHRSVGSDNELLLRKILKGRRDRVMEHKRETDVILTSISRVKGCFDVSIGLKLWTMYGTRT